MSPDITTPGVYIEEIPSGAHIISETPTDITAFVGESHRGSRTKAIEIHSLSDFERQYGRGSPLHTSVFLFFENGGKRAVIVRQRDSSLKAFFQALHALNEIDQLNLLCLPSNMPIEPDKIYKAANYCESRRSFLLLDTSPDWFSVTDTINGMKQIGITSRNAAAYFPRLRGRGSSSISACGAIAGVYARSDKNSGVWKSPAGIDAVLHSVNGLSMPVDNATIQQLTKASINCIKEDVNAGPVIWGARTLAGNDNEWRYIAVRRTALFIENSILNGTKWVVFEPNGEPLWQQLVQSVHVFMMSLFQRSAFQGSTPDDAFYIRCDTTTMTPHEIAAGKVNLILGFAPLKPAEFVILRFDLQSASP
jgi:phage tail sheath protein FI